MLSIALSLFLLIWLSNQFNNIYYPKKCSQLNFLPMPNKLSCTLNQGVMYHINNPCNIRYSIKHQSAAQKKQTKYYKHIIHLIRDQQQKTFKCQQSYIQIINQQPNTNTNILKDNQVQYDVMIKIADIDLKSAFSNKQQGYDLQIYQKYASMVSIHYVGFVRALETFLQSITCNKKSKECYMMALPIIISDYPLYEYRGVLIDSSRHFIPMQLIYQSIDALMYNKMNILHWHIVDEDSFPLRLDSHPELAQYGAFSEYQTYSTQEIKDLVHYALVRGVRIIPEIDTPGHAAIWSKSPQNQNVSCILPYSKYKGALDVTLHKTYKLVQQVFKQVFELFPDPYVHLGGDEVQLSCMKNLTQFLRLQNIKQQQLQIHYRRKQKKMLRAMNSSKKFIYWITDKVLQVEQDDIVHWWGGSQWIPNIKDRKMIISRYVKQFYIDMGAGSILGTAYGSNYATWYDMHTIKFHQLAQKSKFGNNVIGLAVTLWGQVSNMYTFHTKTWIRSSSMAQRSWTLQDYPSKPDFFRRITAHQRLMNRRGIPTAAATNQQCEYSPQFC